MTVVQWWINTVMGIRTLKVERGGSDVIHRKYLSKVHSTRRQSSEGLWRKQSPLLNSAFLVQFIPLIYWCAVLVLRNNFTYGKTGKHEKDEPYRLFFRIALQALAIRHNRHWDITEHRERKWAICKLWICTTFTVKVWWKNVVVKSVGEYKFFFFRTKM